MIKMEQIKESPTKGADSFARSQIYHLLAIGFRYPNQEWFELYKRGYFMAEILKLLSTLPRLSEIALEEAVTGDKIYMDLGGVDYWDFEAKYAQTFDVVSTDPPCPMYSSFYVTRVPRPEILLQLTVYYKQFGLVMHQNGGKAEPQDHLSVELEFLHFLTLKEFQARKENQGQLLNDYLQAQKDFLERHIIDWFPIFYKKVQQVDQLPFYPDLARIARRFTHCEYEFMSALTEFG